MLIEIWDRETANGETVTMAVVNGTGTQHANHEAAFEYLNGLVKELQAAITTASAMYLRSPNDTVHARLSAVAWNGWFAGTFLVSSPAK